MNRKLKATLMILGLAAAILVVSQLVMGLLIVRAGGEGADPTAIRKLIKTHQHSGYLTVTVSLIYIVASLAAITRTPGRLAADPVNRA